HCAYLQGDQLQPFLVTLNDPAALITQRRLLEPLAPGLRPARQLHGGSDPQITQNRSDPKLMAAPLIDELLSVAHQPTQLTRLLRGQPDPRQVPDAFQVRQHVSVAAVGLVERLLPPGHISGMSQVY